MTIPRATAEASLYRSTGAYGGGSVAAAPGDGRVLSPQQSGVSPVVPRLPIDLAPIIVRPCRPSWQCQIEYWLCQGQIPRCIDRCLSNNLYQCAFAADPQACEARLWQMCSGQCQVACEAAYRNCLDCR
jgi:hypothetical protein